MQIQRALAPPRVAIYNRPKVRAVFYQLVLLAALLWLGVEFALNAKALSLIHISEPTRPY